MHTCCNIHFCDVWSFAKRIYSNSNFKKMSFENLLKNKKKNPIPSPSLIPAWPNSYRTTPFPFSSWAGPTCAATAKPPPPFPFSLCHVGPTRQIHPLPPTALLLLSRSADGNRAPAPTFSTLSPRSLWATPEPVLLPRDHFSLPDHTRSLS